MDGVAEDAAEFRRDDDALTGAGRFRRIAGIGPVYEVVELGRERLRVRLVDEDEIFEYPRVEAESDPLA